MNKKERKLEDLEIDLKDMVLYVLKRWRSICLCVLILGILGGTFGYVRGEKAQEQRKADEEITDKEKQPNSQEAILQALEKSYAYNNQYLLNSGKMQLGWYGYYKGSLNYVISENSVSEAEVVFQMYRKKMNSREVYEKIARAAGEEEKAEYYKSLLEVFKVTDNESEGMEDSRENGKKIMFSIVFFHNNEEVCANVIKVLEEEMNTFYDEITRVGQEHELLLFSDELEFAEAEELTKEQQDVAGTQLELIDKIDKISLIISAAEEESANAEVIGSTKKETVKYGILGILAGAVLTAGFYAIFYIADGRVHTKADVRTLTGEEVLAVLTVKRKKRLFAGIDKIFDHITAKRDGFGNSPEMLKFRLKEYADKENIRELYVTGSCMKQENSFAKLLEQVKPEGVLLKMSPDFLDNAEERRKVIESGHVVLVEQAEKTDVRTLLEEMKLLNCCGVKAAGVVLLR